MMRVSGLIFTGLLCSCGNPIDELNKVITSHGYIPYTTPMRFAGSGTLVGGRPSALSLVGHPQTCFPDQSSGVDTVLRKRDETDLPGVAQNIKVDASLFAELFKGLGAGTPSLSMGVHIGYVKAIQISFKGPHIDYLDSISISDFYRTKINATCKDYLDKVGFIIQALGVDEMEFKFYDSTGGQIQLTLDNVSQYVNIAADASWSIQNGYSLLITTPKYIGYQLGALRKEDKGMSLYRATRVANDEFVFEKLNVFSSGGRVMEIENLSNAQFFVSKENLDKLAIPVK